VNPLVLNLPIPIKTTPKSGSKRINQEIVDEPRLHNILSKYVHTPVIRSDSNKFIIL